MSETSPTIVFIHGNFVTKHCWDEWAERFTTRGFRCVQIAYPGRDKSIAELQAEPDAPILKTLTLPQVVDHHVKIIRSLGEKPILIGHSFGGLLTQLMVQRDLPTAAVAIDSVPPQGVLALRWSFFRSLWPVLNPFIPKSRPYFMPFSDFQYTFVNDLPLAEQRAAYDATVVPESRSLGRGGISNAARIDFARRRAPLLLIAGENDNIMPVAVNRQNYLRYRKSPSVTEFKEFPGRTHYSVINGPGWEEVADYALDWALAQTRKAAAPPT